MRGDRRPAGGNGSQQEGEAQRGKDASDHAGDGICRRGGVERAETIVLFAALTLPPKPGCQDEAQPQQGPDTGLRNRVNGPARRGPKSHQINGNPK